MVIIGLYEIEDFFTGHQLFFNKKRLKLPII